MINVDQRHQPAFVDQIVKLFNLKPGDLFLDCTLGDGSHSQEALEIKAKVISLDVDEEAIERSRHFIPKFLQSNWTIYRENFSQVDNLFQKEKLPSPDAIILDLGTSQYQLANPDRGFSFQKDAPLDMRLDNRLGLTAKDLINALTEAELARLFFELADETYAKRIAKAIVERRKRQSINTTKELADLITAVKKNRRSIHPATKVFQALRMAVNLERESLSTGISACFSRLKSQGRLGVISFHSGEDRLIKHYFRTLVRQNLANLLSQKLIKPTETELLNNQKIRSAKLRLIQKI
jgi:16S rRNA (cytosine1402-N4)-methyltransferase